MYIKVDFRSECAVFLVCEDSHGKRIYAHYNRPCIIDDKTLMREAFVKYADLSKRIASKDLSAVYVARSQDQLDRILKSAGQQGLYQ